MGNSKKKLALKAGFTLIELIVTIGILGIVLTMAFSMGAFGNISFNNGSSKAGVQSNIRLAANYITKELRYSSNANILTTLPATDDLIENYKYIYVENGILKQYDNVNGTNKGKITNIVGDTSNRISLLNFEITKSKTVYFNVEGAFNNQILKLDSTVLLLNIDGHPYLVSGNGAVISYTTESTTVTIPSEETPYVDDLVEFEKNMINIVDPTADISFSNVAFNPDSNSNVLIQSKTLIFSNSGNNIKGNIFIQADTLNWGNTATSSGYDAVLDVKNFVGSPNGLNTNNYGPNSFNKPSWNGVQTQNWHKISEYPAIGYWKYMFNDIGNVKNMTVRSLKDNINFKDTSVNPNDSLNSKIHYFSGNSLNKITDNKLPDYKGDISSVANVNSGNYEYIICHGPLTINTTDKNNGYFNFKGIIYCDDVVNFNDLNSQFSGIIIAKGLIVSNVIGNQAHNWNIKYQKYDSEVNWFNTILGKITRNSL